MENKEERRKRHRESALRPPRLSILTDLPLKQDDVLEDPFDLEFRIGPVYDIIRHPGTRTPMAIAIYGDWGAGKTSAMRWLDDKLGIWTREGKPAEHQQKVSVKTVWFYPWKYQTRDDVWRGLIAEVILKSIDLKDATLGTVTNAARRFAGFLGSSFVHVLAAIKLKGAPAGVGAEVSLSAIKDVLDEYKTASHPEKPYLNEFEQTLSEWLRNTLDEHERMVIFIDDLDRCMPGVALEVLEALKLYLNISPLFCRRSLRKIHLSRAEVSEDQLRQLRKCLPALEVALA